MSTSKTTTDFPNVVKDLKAQAGMAVVDLTDDTASLLESTLKTARFALDAVEDDCASQHVRRIQPDEDSAHVTGYHPASVTEGMSRYNAHRRGFVFSDGDTQCVDSVPQFQVQMTHLSECLHQIAQTVFTQMELQWNLPHGWFENALGPTNLHSQWHVKEYVPPADVDDDEWLPMHTDPSLISILVHDAPGKQRGAMGLEYQALPNSDGKREWLEVPFHGHAVATVLIGSVLSYITGGLVNSCKHRVRVPAGELRGPQRRMTATLFLRPRRTAQLVVPPSPMFDCVVLRRKLTFDEWSKRVSRNYMKRRAIQPHMGQSDRTSSPSEEGYFRDEWTEVSLLDCDPPLSGREKYLGGERGNNDKIYTIPGHALRVLVIDPTVEPPTVKPIGPSFDGEYKWLRGVRMSTGIIYGIPCHADAILRINPENDSVSTIEWDDTDPGAPTKGMPWKWHGGNISRLDGCLYCIPQYAEYVLKIDPVTETTSFLMGDGPLVGRNKWYGGLVSPIDDAIYGINQNAKGILRIDPGTQKVTVHGDFPEGQFKWHGGVLGPDGCIYGIPAHADTVLKIEPGVEPRLSTIGGPLRTGRHRSDGKYKYLGGAVGHDGNVYFFPSDSDYVLQVDPRTNVVREVGPCLADIEHIHNNKWQNGFTAPDGTIYGIPLKSGSILRIRPGDGINPDVSTIGGPYRGLNKWEGGVMSKNGDMFCMPLNHRKVLRMKPVNSK
ncbi:hypothetical protein MHU86_24356 [Fragilaria crotonensis]|nr:hypothetical protein MHU86_24356 [Fragilaria crotonensis]